MSEKRWKRTERKTCEYYECDHTGLKRGKSVPDGKNDFMILEVKDREKLPKWLLEAWYKLLDRNTTAFIPVLHIHKKGWTTHESLAITSAACMKWLVKKAEAQETQK